MRSIRLEKLAKMSITRLYLSCVKDAYGLKILRDISIILRDISITYLKILSKLFTN
jgi:hypothetical protein